MLEISKEGLPTIAIYFYPINQKNINFSLIHINNMESLIKKMTENEIKIL